MDDEKKGTKNANLHKAKSAKNDEFYTQLSDIEKEIKFYKQHFAGKTVLCNCDDPRVSNFFKFFAMKFNDYGLKRLITTCYKTTQTDVFSQNLDAHGLSLDYDGSQKRDHWAEADELDIKVLEGNGDFRSPECVALLKEADIVCTNPPFSLFREYVAQLMEYDKKFIIIGNKNALTYKEIFQLVKENRMWVGMQPMGVDMLFNVPSDVAENLQKTKKEGSAYRIVDEAVMARSTSCWFTNLDMKKRHEEFVPYMWYYSKPGKDGHVGMADFFPKYDNYDAINVDKTTDIPKDWSGVMGVPISFLDRYNPEQFEIVGKMANTKIDEFNFGYPFVNGVRKYARILIKWKKGAKR